MDRGYSCDRRSWRVNRTGVRGVWARQGLYAMHGCNLMVIQRKCHVDVGPIAPYQWNEGRCGRSGQQLPMRRKKEGVCAVGQNGHHWGLSLKAGRSFSERGRRADNE
jgi:hypothetical protein